MTAMEKDVGAPVTNGRRPRPGPRRRRGLGVLILVILVCAAAAVVVVLRPWHHNAKGDPFRNNTPYALAKISKGDLSATTQQNGKLGYAGDYQLVNKASGTVTDLPAAGDVIDSGKPLYRIEGEPVLLLKGAYVPVYRALTKGLRGLDVKQLNAALVDLKYATKAQIDPTSDYYSASTYAAVYRMQQALGLKKTGGVPLGQVLFVPLDKARIIKVNAAVGGSVGPGQAVLEVSSTDRQASLQLNAAQQAQVKVGDQVTLTLPNSQTTPGEVASIGKIATTVGDTTTVDVAIKLLKPEDTGSFDQTPVQIAIISETAKDVLSVPVNALLALAGGGYAVEIVDAAGAHTLVRVQTGLVDNSNGRIEISGSGLSEGETVVVPAS
jgi:peptidoglycan hydrolase-like protein with peptidoglycan-binding domain